MAVRGLPSGFTFTKDMLTAHFVHSDLPREPPRYRWKSSRLHSSQDASGIVVGRRGVADAAEGCGDDVNGHAGHPERDLPQHALRADESALEHPDRLPAGEPILRDMSRWRKQKLGLSLGSVMWRRRSPDTKALCAVSARSVGGWVVSAAAPFAYFPQV